MIKNGILFLATILIAIHACENSTVEYERYKGNTIELPDSVIICSIRAVGHNTKEVKFSNIRVIVIIDGECGFCFQQLGDWGRILSTYKSEFESVEFLFIVRAFDFIAVDEYIKTIDISLPIYYDKNGRFVRSQKMIEDNDFNTIVLNDKNQIEYIGNPIYKKKDMRKFIKTLNRMISKRIAS